MLGFSVHLISASDKEWSFDALSKIWQLCQCSSLCFYCIARLCKCIAIFRYLIVQNSKNNKPFSFLFQFQSFWEFHATHFLVCLILQHLCSSLLIMTVFTLSVINWSLRLIKELQFVLNILIIRSEIRSIVSLYMVFSSVLP